MLGVSGGQPFGQGSINIFAQQQRATCLFAVPSTSGAGPPCRALAGSSGARLVPCLGWPESPGPVQQGRGHLGELVFQRDFLLCSPHRGGRVTGERWPLHSNMGVLVLIPVCPEASPAVSKDGCQTRRIACQQQPSLRHHLFMDPLGFPVESVAAGYPLSKTR